MALTLECNCSGNVSLCNLTQLIWHVEIDIAQVGPIGALGHILLDSGVPGVQADISLNNPADAGTYEFNLLPLADWGNPTAYFTIDQTLFQVDGTFYKIRAIDSIEQKYQCVNVVTGSSTEKIIIANPLIRTNSQCMTGDDIRSQCSGLTGILYKSTPLGACNGCASTESAYTPSPDFGVMIDVDNSGLVCLCATGGSGDYTYSITAGSLPCGQSLDPDTGCIRGEPDGTCDGQSPITFRVTDKGGGGTGTTSGGVTIGGTCNVFGPGVTRTSGGAFTPDMAGHTITIATVAGAGWSSFTVVSVADSDHMTISPADGIVEGTSWSYTSPVITTPPPPHAPEFAEVTCGMLFGCPTEGRGIGNQAF